MQLMNALFTGGIAVFAMLQPVVLAGADTTPQPAAQDELIVPSHPAVRRLVFELMAEGFERRAQLISQGVKQDELTFLQLMHESYRRADRAGLPQAYIAYMDELIMWIDETLPQLAEKAGQGDSRTAAIFEAYEDKLKQLSIKYKQPHATLTSQNNEFNNLLEQSGVGAKMRKHLMDNKQAFRDAPEESLLEHYALLAGWLREQAAASR